MSKCDGVARKNFTVGLEGMLIVHSLEKNWERYSEGVRDAIGVELVAGVYIYIYIYI